jgi:hypothetical protein
MYTDLKDFIVRRMRLSHIYQPVMLMTLLQSNGVAHETDIARNLVLHDQSQIEYYTKINAVTDRDPLRLYSLSYV